MELHTGEYANAKDIDEARRHCGILADAAQFAGKAGLNVHAGHGLTYSNIRPVAEISEIEGFYIGHSIMARALYVGLNKAVKDMLQLIE